ncbi:MAG: M20 family metallopeptidase [Gemmatimonadota bacterium]|nr:M20 family metallopeptidase [Gemmatimonadota bacterium]
MTGQPPGVERSPAPEVRDRMEALRPEFVDFLRQIVLEESPSTDPEAQAGVRALLGEALRGIGLEVEYVPGRRTGGQLLARGDGSGASPQLLLGHMDTVWPVGTLARMPVEESEGMLRGPGVFDMKAGLAIGVFALRAMRDVGADPAVDPVFLITSDEEIGSPESEPLITQWARRSARAFILEPALGLAGRIKTRRKGVGHFTVEVSGKSAHGGLAPEEGASAILELAQVIQRVQGLADPERGISVNVGVIEGGSRANVVADRARAEVDVRVWTGEDAAYVEEAIAGLEPTVPGTSIHVAGEIGRDPLERTPRNARLWERARAVGRELGLELEEGSAGGASDGNITSAYTATLDGLGAVGDGAHALHEFVYVDRALERVALLAGLLAAPREGART